MKKSQGTWTHESVYQALVERGAVHQVKKTKQFIYLYEQKPDCALLYAADSKKFSKAPLLLHPGRKSWIPDIYGKLLPAIGTVRLGPKSVGQKAQRFLHCEVADWSVFAKAVGL